jgi:hypothetical protein
MTPAQNECDSAVLWKNIQDDRAEFSTSGASGPIGRVIQPSSSH